MFETLVSNNVNFKKILLGKIKDFSVNKMMPFSIVSVNFKTKINDLLILF